MQLAPLDSIPGYTVLFTLPSMFHSRNSPASWDCLRLLLSDLMYLSIDQTTIGGRGAIQI